MKNVIELLNKAFENRIRLGIMSALMVNESVDFLELKELLNVTDGNLASHLSALEREDYIAGKKEFVGKKTRTSFVATNLGKKEFHAHINALERLVIQNKK
ncbi:MAG: transcriptional regulator [Chitinophagales bacterium]